MAKPNHLTRESRAMLAHADRAARDGGNYKPDQRARQMLRCRQWAEWKAEQLGHVLPDVCNFVIVNNSEACFEFYAIVPIEAPQPLPTIRVGKSRVPRCVTSQVHRHVKQQIRFPLPWYALPCADAIKAQEQATGVPLAQLAACKPADARYTIGMEYCGHAEPRHVARFCSDWIGQTESSLESLNLVFSHQAARNLQMESV